MRPIGPKWASEAAGLPTHSYGADGIIEVHDQQNRLVKIWKDDAGVVQESRTPEPKVAGYDAEGKPCLKDPVYVQATEEQINTIKTVLASHDHTLPRPDADWEARYDSLPKDIKALGLVVMEEINLIRGASAATIAGMADRTEAQLRTAWANKRKTL